MNRFDLEQSIIAVQDMQSDLETFLRLYADGPHIMTEDEVWNYISGIQHVLKLRGEKLWDTYLQVFQLDEYSPNQVHFANIDGEV